jgi:hypothetical protein
MSEAGEVILTLLDFDQQLLEVANEFVNSEGGEATRKALSERLSEFIGSVDYITDHRISVVYDYQSMTLWFEVSVMPSDGDYWVYRKIEFT